MNRNVKKGWEPFVIKIMAIAMSICYVFGPSHKEVNNALHYLLHQFEKPKTVLVHSKLNDAKHENHYTYFLKNKEEKHQHTLLEVLNEILKVCDVDDSPENQNITFKKIDKHLRSKQSLKNKNLVLGLYIKHRFPHLNEHIHQGFLKTNLQPPQLI
ncbi:hypothetical protein [uncultured Algibacter sp.]|uniref:hypothetical protein n=1 Tax=uncultured Algibacter sp. TaxID=298659 RepID=UPI0026111B01|nr:hypothetical protein [uncultured Algibacter sp.]